MIRVLLVSLLAGLTLSSQLAQAQAWPARPVRIVVPFTPGGGVDITARTIAIELTKRLGQPVTVENKPGAGGTVAAAEVARSAPDGHTLFLTLNSLHAITPLVYAKLPFDAIKDFAWVTPLVQFNNVLVVNPAASLNSMQALIAAAKATPGKLTFASSGNGTNLHLVGELFKSMAGIDLLHVPYKGSAPAMTDLLAGRVDMMFETIPAAVSHLRGGKLRALAVSGGKRSAQLADVPTVAEAGLPGFEVLSWYGLVAPAGTPQAIIARLNAEAARGADAADFRARMEPLGFDVATSSPEAMAARVQADIARWAPIIKAAGVRIE